MENNKFLINPSAPHNSVKAGVTAFFKNPVSQFVIFGVILFVLQALSMGGMISSTFMETVKLIMIYAIVSMGYCFLLGYAGLASLGTAGFFGVGIYISYFLIGSGVPMIVALIVAIAVAVVFGLVVGFISLRIEGMYLAIITLGLAEVLRYTLKAVRSQNLILTESQLKIFGSSIGANGMFFVICVMLIVLMIIISNLIKSPTGRAMVAMKNSTSASQAFGVSLLKYRLLAFVIATVFAVLGGVAFALSGNSISPSSEAETNLKLTLSLNILGAVIIGGYKSIWGSFFGTFIVLGLSSLFVIILPNDVYNAVNPYISVIVGVLIILVVMFFPGGLAQLMGELKQKIKKLINKRKESKYGKNI